MSRPIAVIISDVHFTISTLELATISVETALNVAESLGIPLILNGDTLDTKALIRAECANRLIKIFKNKKDTQVYINTGNHDLLHEKAIESSLNFLSPYCHVVTHPVFISSIDSWIIPYQNSPEAFKKILKGINPGSRIICHQGLIGTNSGHYIVDSSAIDKSDISDYRIISGHYHKSQDIKIGRARRGAVGLWSYIGNPYTLTFGEANDPPKGYKILYDDGILFSKPLNLRKHTILNLTLKDLQSRVENIGTNDILWVKIEAPRFELSKLKKKDIGETLFGHQNFKLDLIPTDYIPQAQENQNMDLTPWTVLDKIIDESNETPETKILLKEEWRKLNPCSLVSVK